MISEENAWTQKKMGNTKKSIRVILGIRKHYNIHLFRYPGEMENGGVDRKYKDIMTANFTKWINHQNTHLKVLRTLKFIYSF